MSITEHLENNHNWPIKSFSEIFQRNSEALKTASCISYTYYTVVNLFLHNCIYFLTYPLSPNYLQCQYSCFENTSIWFPTSVASVAKVSLLKKQWLGLYPSSQPEAHPRVNYHHYHSRLLCKKSQSHRLVGTYKGLHTQNIHPSTFSVIKIKIIYHLFSDFKHVCNSVGYAIILSLRFFTIELHLVQKY